MVSVTVNELLLFVLIFYLFIPRKRLLGGAGEEGQHLSTF